jgi:hypothetical protein
VTSDEGDIGRGHMQRFQDVETRTPVILTTSQLLTSGLDAPLIDPGNSLRFKLTDIGERDRVDVILTNPPFGGTEIRNGFCLSTFDAASSRRVCVSQVDGMGRCAWDRERTNARMA